MTLDDDKVLARLRDLAAGTARIICPDCGRREIPDHQDRCAQCTDDRRNATKRSWWHEQNDWPGLVIKHGPGEAATRWLAHQLRRGPLDSTELKRRARQVGISDGTRLRALRRLRNRGIGGGTRRQRVTTSADPDDARRLIYRLGSEPDGSELDGDLDPSSSPST